MKNKFLKLALYCQRFGFFRGCSIIAKFFFSRKGKVIPVHLPDMAHPVYLRAKTSDEYIFQQIFIKKEYEISLNRKPETIIDAGANIGFAAVYFANCFPDAQIICLEPETNNYTLLKKNIQHYPNITALNKGLWDKSSSLQIIDEGLDNWGFSVRECESDTPGAVLATSLPDLQTEFSLEKLDLVKIDIEGSEKEVLSADNVHSWLSKCNTLIIELHDRMKKGTSKTLFNALSPYDAVLDLKGENLIFQISTETKS